jgi:hypothetical protein
MLRPDPAVPIEPMAACSGRAAHRSSFRMTPRRRPSQSARLAGRYAAIRIVRGINYGVNTEWLRLFDLRAGGRGHELWPLGLPTHAGDVLQDYVLTARGALA